MSGCLEAIEKTIREKKLFREKESILVAVSGGLDSMVLLALLQRLSIAHGWRLVVAHYNHQLRGAASDADEALVRRTGAALGYEVITGRGDVKQLAKQSGLSLEMAARQLRHEFLAQTAVKSGIRSVALGHHGDDQVELFFFAVVARGWGWACRHERGQPFTGEWEHSAGASAA